MEDTDWRAVASPELIQKSMKQAAEDVIALEPKLTEWDTVSPFTAVSS
jgi:hypothetical protein